MKLTYMYLQVQVMMKYQQFCMQLYIKIRELMKSHRAQIVEYWRSILKYRDWSW